MVENTLVQGVKGIGGSVVMGELGSVAYFKGLNALFPTGGDVLPASIWVGSEVGLLLALAGSLHFGVQSLSNKNYQEYSIYSGLAGLSTSALVENLQTTSALSDPQFNALPLEHMLPYAIEAGVIVTGAMLAVGRLNALVDHRSEQRTAYATAKASVTRRPQSK